MSQISNNRRRRAIRRGIIIVLLLIVGPAAYLIYGATRDTTPVVRTALLANGDIASVMTITAQIRPGTVQEAYVGRQLVSRVHVAVGDQVSKGDPLITFDLTDLEKQLEETRSLRQQAEDAVTAMTAMIENQASSSQQALTAMQKQITQLSASLDRSMAALTKMGSLPPIETAWNDEQIAELARRLAAIEPGAVDVEDQIRAILADLGGLLELSPSPAYQDQLQVLQKNLNGMGSSFTALIAGLGNPDLLAALGSGSSLAGQAGSLASSAQTALVQAVQAEALAEQALSSATEVITADFDGVVADIQAEEGEYTSAASGSLGGSLGSSLGSSLGGSLGSSLSGLSATTTRVLVLYDNVRPMAVFQANRYDSDKLAIGMPVSYYQDGRYFHGRITYKSKFATSMDLSDTSSADTLLGSMSSVSGLSSEPMLDLEMSIEGDRLSDLTLGFNIDAEIQTASARDVLLLPAEAMKKELGAYYVFVIGDDSRLIRQEIEPGIQSDTYAQVLSGLTAGTRVVLNPTNSLSAGMLVRERQGE